MKSVRERFLSKIKIDEVTGCWEWVSAKNADGYGLFSFNRRAHGAHRVSYEIHIGLIPWDKCVCHRCDNRGCVNPDHLFLGSQVENISDMDAKSRRACGDKVANKGKNHPLAKLSEADIKAIRATKGVTQRSLAKQYGISFQQISRIITGKRWAHL